MTKIYLFKEVHRVDDGVIEQSNTVREWSSFDGINCFVPMPTKQKTIFNFTLYDNCCTERVIRKLEKKHLRHKEFTIVVNVDNIETTIIGKITHMKIDMRMGIGSISYTVGATEEPRIEQRIDWNNVRGET